VTDLPVHIHILGPVEIVADGREIPIAGKHQRALIAALASEAGRVVSGAQLIDTLWGDRPPATARTKLQGHVCAVRKALNNRAQGTAARWPLLTRPPGYLLSIEGVSVDLLRYRSLLTDAADEMEAGRVAAASHHLAAALALWRGSAFGDVDAPNLVSVAAALERGRLLATERKAECDLQLGRYDAVAEEISLVLADHPYREASRAALMLALYRRGCRAEALESYRACWRLLRDQLGIEPGHLLRRLHEMMLSDDPRLALPELLAVTRWRSQPATG
jgi:DNA-binding SARP family transcriptional activator